MHHEDSQHVVLVSSDGEPCGTQPKRSVHSASTPLHLGFSCHVLSPGGDVLVTRRALTKRTWPGVWTNSFCGHPAPGEDWADAVARHGFDELGLELTELSLVLQSFRYRATDASGVVENEICPVFTAVTSSRPEPDPSEAMEIAWSAPDDVSRAIHHAPWAFSPWFSLQVPQMDVYGTQARPSIGAADS